MKIGELFVQLGFKGDDAKLRDFISGMGELNITSVLAGLGVAGAALEVVNFTAKLAGAAQEIRNFHVQTGQSEKDLQQWGALAERAGVKADVIASSVRALQSAVTAIKFGGGNIAPFQMLGIDPRGKDMFELMKEIGGVVDNLDPAVARFALSMMGLDESMISVFRTMRELSPEDMPFIKSEQIDMLTEARRAWVGFGKDMYVLLSRISPLIPAVTLLGQALEFVAEQLLRITDGIAKLRPGDVGSAVMNAFPPAMAYRGIQAAAAGPAGRVIQGGIHIMIDGAMSPTMVARHVADEIKKLFGDAEYQMAQENR